jgi:UDP-N-acetylglucosamine 2-epimerase (non-hydrolysing)
VRIMTVLGTRPEIIRLSLIMPILDRHVDHTVVHTGQNYEPSLSEVFFRELALREPDIRLTLSDSAFGAQVGSLLAQIEPVFLERRPDRLLLLGDTNSSLVAIVARRLGIPVYHMEAGNRCFDDRVPEEVNRRIIDHCSSVLMPYTNNSRANLIAEGISSDRIYVIGNPIAEVMNQFGDSINSSGVLERLGLKAREFFLVTLHRAENVDRAERLRKLVEILKRLHREYGYPVVTSLHPRTRARLQEFAIGITDKGIRLAEPFGFFDYSRLERAAFCVLSDSGTVQEECALLRIPNVTLRDVTERPETLEVGSNALTGEEQDRTLSLVRLVTGEEPRWTPPLEYERTNVSDTVARILMSYRPPDAAEQRWRSLRS